MIRLFLLVLVVLSLPTRIKAEEPFYSDTLMETDYDFFSKKELLENGYIYKFRTRYESNSRKALNDWQNDNCLKSIIYGQIVPAIARYGYEKGKRELI